MLLWSIQGTEWSPTGHIGCVLRAVDGIIATSSLSPSHTDRPAKDAHKIDEGFVPALKYTFNSRLLILKQQTDCLPLTLHAKSLYAGLPTGQARSACARAHWSALSSLVFSLNKAKMCLVSILLRTYTVPFSGNHCPPVVFRASIEHSAEIDF